MARGLAGSGRPARASKQSDSDHVTSARCSTQTQRFLPTYRPWPPPIVLHHYLASSAPQLHPRRALNPLTMAIGPPNESPIHCVMHVALDASPVGARWLKHFWSDTFKILTG